jgi:transposase-like protein
LSTPFGCIIASALSLRDVETILAARGIVVSYETIRDWGLRFGRAFANACRRQLRAWRRESARRF